MGQSKGKNVVAWSLQVLLAVGFVIFAFPKLTGAEEAVANFERWGFAPWFRILTGVLELLGAIGLLIPGLAFFAAGGLGVLMLGAAWTHISHDEASMVVMPLAFLVALAVVAFLRLPGRR